jgi:N-methylhydantoinase A/acetophenone carboxylase
MRDDRVEMVKVPTTPHDLTVCFFECIKAGADRFGVPVEDLLYETEIIRFSNTIGTNTIIQRDGSKVGLLVTAGRETAAPTDSLDGKPPLINPEMVLGIDEEVSPRGEVLKTPDDRVALSCAQELIDRGARCLVVAFSNSEFNPENEQLLRRIIKHEYPRDFLGSVPVFLSSDISRRSGEVERINAASLNAYIHAKLVRLLYKAGEDLRQRLYQKSLFIVHNNGAVARVAKTRAINTYNSGPSAGLLGARLIGQRYGISDLISADMGGTSFDIGYVQGGQVTLAPNPDVEGFAVNVPMLAIRAIGAGGGSIATVENGTLQVGPQSAGALPGPVCFDLGGTAPTVTDADLILGILDPSFFLGGTMKLSREKARTVMEEKVARPLGLSVEEAAGKVKNSIDQAMGSEIKKLKEQIWQEGEDPPLVVYGGAGPAHCCEIADVAGIGKIIITPFSPVFSAFASSSMDVGHLYSRRVDLLLEKHEGLKVLNQHVAAMQEEALKDMRGEGFTTDQVTGELELLVQPGTGGTEVQLAAETDFFNHPSKVDTATKQALTLLKQFGVAAPKDLMLTTVSLRVWAPVSHYESMEQARTSKDLEIVQKGKRTVFLDSKKGWCDVIVYEGHNLEHGHQIAGPALIETEHTTLLVASGWKARVDQFTNTILEKVS